MLGCRFYQTENGGVPVREWLRSLSVEAKKEIGGDIESVQWQWPVSMPLVGALGNGLFEVRTKCEQIQYRVLFGIVGGSMVLLHAFVKKTRTAPKEIAIGRARLKNYEKEEP